MANWKRFIEVEITLPYITQGCTLGKQKTTIKITAEDIWLSLDVWRASIRIGKDKIGFYGKRSMRKNKNGILQSPSTYKVRAFRLMVNDNDIPDNNSEFFDVRVLSWS